MKKLVLVSVVIAFAITAQAQSRYLDEVFTKANVTSNVVYGSNYSFLTGLPVLSNLVMDVYQPQDDWIAERPLIIYLHTGSFLPILFNGTPTGDMHDSATVEMCKQFARRGYVSVAMDYRVGWNPLGSGNAGQDIRTGTLLQAVYRSLQDVKTCVRFFKMTARDQGNPWRIDTNKVILVGQGSGGYIALATVTLNDPTQIQLSKFIATNDASTYFIYAGQPYVLQSVWGDFDGFGGDTSLNHANWPGYTSNVQFAVNMGGALGDSSWLQAGNVPMICFHVPNDPYAPYGYGPVIVPTTGQFVVNVSGSHDVVRRADYLGNNASFNQPFNDPYTTRANQVNEGNYGLFPFVLPANAAYGGIGQAGPWEWWDSTSLQALGAYLGFDATTTAGIITGGLVTNPDMSKTKALNYIDSIQGYLNPRLAVSLGLDTTHINIGVPQVDLGNDVKMFPVPAQSFFTLQLDNVNEQMQYLQIFDMTGRLVREISGINAPIVKINRDGLNNGMYTMKIGMKDRVLTGKLIFQ